ncbi:hypothetical protein D3C85_772020 [compost metagenome]
MPFGFDQGSLRLLARSDVVQQPDRQPGRIARLDKPRRKSAQEYFAVSAAETNLTAKYAVLAEFRIGYCADRLVVAFAGIHDACALPCKFLGIEAEELLECAVARDNVAILDQHDADECVL